MTERDRNIRNLKAIGSGVTTALVSLSCLTAGLAPIQAETPTGNTDNSSQSLTETPGVETDEAYVNNEFDWTANPAAVQKTLEETGLPPAQVGGYSVIIGRDSIQVVGSDGQLTSPAPVPVDFVTTSGLGFDSKGDPVVQDNLITVDPETGESIRIPLYRGIETDDNGRQWVVQGYFKDTEDIDGTTLTKYPQSASKDIEEGKPTFMLFYPTPYINALLYRDPEDTTPIRVDIKPDSSQNVVSVATPFSNQVIDISYNPAIPKPPQISPTVAPATVVASTSTPENTPTPVKEYSCPTNPEATNMSNITLKDIQSGELAKWARSQPGFNIRLSANPASLDYQVDYSETTDKSHTLRAEDRNNPNNATEHSAVLGLCKINPIEFGIEGKNDVLVVISVAQDKNDLRVVQFTLTTLEIAKKLYTKGIYTNSNAGVNLREALNSYGSPDFIAHGAQANGPDDQRKLCDEDGVLYGVQETEFRGQKGQAALVAAFEDVAANDVFSDDVIKLFETTITFGAAYNVK